MNARAFLASVSIALAALAAHAQQPAWPSKPVKIIAVFPAGGSVDQVARILAAQLGQQMGQTFVVDNRGGASGSIGTQVVASSPPDGYTFGLVFDTHAVNPSLLKLPFDTVKDLASVTLIGTSPMAIVAHPSQPYRDFRDVLAAAKKKPGEIAFGSIGTGSLGHLAMAQIGDLEHVSFTHVPYRGGGPLMTDAVGGQVPVAIGTVFLVNPHVRAGKLKALAVTSAKGSPQMPGVAPVADQGVPGFSALSWWGIVAPAGTPPVIVQRMHEEVAKALKTPAVAEKLTQQGMDIVGGGPRELDKFLRAEIDRWAEVVRAGKIKAGD
jgi:tripartite-type tricarboxylate transporter receptor subunit TctC